jgi:hypothetical protein
MMAEVSAEQQARDMLERLDVEDAQSYSSGDLVELANLIAEVDRLRELIRRGLAYGDSFRTPYAAGARVELRRAAGMTPPLHDGISK